jgi:hypothetical protein
MGKETKLVYFQIINGDATTIQQLGEALKDIKERSGLDIEFLIGNENIQLRDVKYMLDELYKLYKFEKDLIEKREKLESKVKK